MTSTYHPRRCGCGHHVADPAINDHPISLRDDLDRLTKTVQPRDIRVKLSADPHVASLTVDQDWIAALIEFRDHLTTQLSHLDFELGAPESKVGEAGEELGEKLVSPVAVAEGSEAVVPLLGHRLGAWRVLVQNEIHDDSSTDSGAGTSDAPTVEADTPSRVGIGVEDATTPAPSTSDDIVSVSISLTGDRELVELVAALVIGGVK